MRNLILLFLPILGTSLSLQTIDIHSENKEAVIAEVLEIQKSLLLPLTTTEVPASVQTGFLTIQMTPDYLYRFIQKGKILIANCEDKIVGYLLLGEMDEYIDWARKHKFDSEWNLDSLKEAHYIDQIAVLALFARKRIGTALIDYAKTLSPKGLLTDILFEPYPNLASIAFFTKNEFVELGLMYIEANELRPAHAISLMLWRYTAPNIS